MYSGAICFTAFSEGLQNSGTAFNACVSPCYLGPPVGWAKAVFVLDSGFSLFSYLPTLWEEANAQQVQRVQVRGWQISPHTPNQFFQAGELCLLPQVSVSLPQTFLSLLCLTLF